MAASVSRFKEFKCHFINCFHYSRHFASVPSLVHPQSAMVTLAECKTATKVVPDGNTVLGTKEPSYIEAVGKRRKLVGRTGFSAMADQPAAENQFSILCSLSKSANFAKRLKISASLVAEWSRSFRSCLHFLFAIVAKQCTVSKKKRQICKNTKTISSPSASRQLERGVTGQRERDRYSSVGIRNAVTRGKRRQSDIAGVNICQ